MNENSGGTPNPLNPEPTATGPNPDAMASEMARSAARATNAMTETVAQPEAASVANPATGPIQEPTPVAMPSNIGPAENGATAVTEPEPKGSVVEPIKKKRKTGLIVGIILCLAAICAAVAALLIINPFAKADKVPAAISKLVSNGAPKVMTVSGTLTVTPSEDYISTFNEFAVTFSAGFDTSLQEDYAEAALTVTLANDSEYEFEAEEVHTADGNLYLKLTGISDILNDLATLAGTDMPAANMPATNCIYDETGETNCAAVDCIDDETGETDCAAAASLSIVTPSLFDSLGVFEVIDDEWILIPMSEFSNVTDLVTLDKNTQCVIDAVGDVSTFANNIKSIYDENQFITYSTDNLAIKQKKDTLYRLGYDNEKLAGFINALPNAGFVNSLYACTGQVAINRDVTAEDVETVSAEFPVIYVEINDNNDFTRLYLSSDSELNTVTADITFGYPTSITIEEPENYLDFNTILNRLLSQLYQMPITEDDTYEEVYEEEVIEETEE